MKRILCTLVLGSALGLAVEVQAAGQASTKELPAALRNLQPATAKILSSNQARQIRGQGAPKFGPHHSSIKHPGNKYTGNRTGQDLKPGYGGLK